MDLKELSQRIKKYQELGFWQQVERAVKRARGETREFIERTHPQVAFGGKSLQTDDRGGKTKHQTVLGRFTVRSNVYSGTVYSNYFQRWYETGATQHPIRYGERKGVLSTYYPARGAIYTQNKNAIENYFVDALDRALKDLIKI